MASNEITVTVRINDEASGPLRELQRVLADIKAHLPMTLCGHCGSTSFDDLRGNCSCCGAPRPAAEYKEWRCVEPPEHVNAKCELAPSLAEMEWTRYRAPRSFYYDAGGPTAIDLIEEIACLGDANRG